MKALFVIDGLGPGGAQRQLVSLAIILKSRGHDIEFFIYNSEHHFKFLLLDANIPIHFYKKKYKYSFAPIFVIWNLLKHGGYDNVLAFLDTPCLYSELACCLIKSVRLIVSERSAYPAGDLGVRKRLIQQMHKLADHITVNSHHQRIRMVREFPWMSKKVQTIYNGYEPCSYINDMNGKVIDKTLNLLVLSSVSFNKNPLNLAIAIHICRDNFNINVNLFWAGAQSVSGDGSQPYEITQEYLLEHGLAQQWMWLGVRSDVNCLLKNCDALIHPSYYEGLPNAICEALVCGRPVLASNVCDNHRLIQHGVSGFLFNPNSPNDIASKIHDYFHLTPDDRATMSINALRFAQDNLSLQRYADEYEEIFLSSN